MTLLDWLIVLLLNTIIIGYGLYLARGTSTSGEWFLARRALPWWAVGLSMFATNVDSGDLVGVTGSTYREGLHIITVYALGSVLGGILAAFWVVPAIARCGYYTNAEYLEARYGPTMRILCALIQIQYRSSMLGLMIWSVFLLLTRLLEIDAMWAWSLIALMVLFAGLYTAWGGLKSVVWTDAAQSVVMFVGSAVTLVTVWRLVGGWDELESTLQTSFTSDGRPLDDLLHVGRYRGDTGYTHPLVVVAGWTVIACGYWTVNHTQTMRLMGTRSLWDMKMAALFGVALSMPVMAASCCLGVLARALPGFESLEVPDEVYPLLARTYLGPGLRGLVVAGVVAAAVSTFDSMGSALSAIFTRDIYARLIAPDREDGHYVLVSRIATVGILGLGFLYLPFILMQENMIKAFTTLIPVFVTPLLVTYLAGVWTRAARCSGLIGLLCGGVYGVVALYDREFVDLAALPPWLTGRWPAFGWSILFTSVPMGLATAFCGLEPTEHAATAKDSGWLGRSREALPALRPHPFAGPLPRWLEPRWYALALLVISAWVVFVAYW